MTTCGTDIIEIYRIKESIERHGKKFLTTIYTENEIEYCEGRKLQKYQHYAVRFAAKEAIYKAISNKVEIPEKWTGFEILRQENGRPYVKLSPQIEEIKNIDISLSHCKEYAIANVVVDWN